MKLIMCLYAHIRPAIFSLLLVAIGVQDLTGQEFSTARVWNEMVLSAIRNDFARPTVHARNLHHTSIAMYDIFAAYDNINETYFLGKTVGGYTCEFEGVLPPLDIEEARKEAISYAVYRLIKHRFQDAPGQSDIFFNVDLVFSAFGYDKFFEGTDYTSGIPAALGNYVAQELISYGLQDGSNEINGYENTFYEPVNPQLNPFNTFFNPQLNFGNPRLNDPNRWQQLNIPGLVDQAGNVIPGGSLPFLSAEWGKVTPFSLTENDRSDYMKEGNEYVVYHDPGPPHLLDTLFSTPSSDAYKWGFSMVAHWRTHAILDSFFMDISPVSIGNIESLPETFDEYQAFYNFRDGGDASRGYDLNPKTGEPYEEQIVQRADYMRVIAEWWADGPESETPPGHWFTILNYVNDQEELVKKYKGTSLEMSDLEWDVKAYFTLAGAMHDAAIAAWSIKGYYDYIRPISAIRYMVDRGQSTNPTTPNYDVAGIPLVPGTIEQILAGDFLLAPDGSNLGDIKQLSNIFEGQRFYSSAHLWTPYQPFNFITPPFAGYVSGHSTFSRAAAEVLTRFTGDPFFPGGLGTYEIPADTYLETQIGPSDSLTLQWATYVDAAHQSALSRIWGGIHPPIDDIPGRRIGIEVGNSAFDLADSLFGDPVSSTDNPSMTDTDVSVFPNPVSSKGKFQVRVEEGSAFKQLVILDNSGREMASLSFDRPVSDFDFEIGRYDLAPGIYNVQLGMTDGRYVLRKLVLLN